MLQGKKRRAGGENERGAAGDPEGRRLDADDEPAGPAQCPQSRDARAAPRRAHAGRGKSRRRGDRARRRGPRLLRRRRRQGDGRGRAQRHVRRARPGLAPAHGSRPPAARDSKADHRHAARRRRRRRSVAGACLRLAHRQRDGAPHHRLRQGGSVRGFRRQLFPDPARRTSEGARALLHVADPQRSRRRRRSAW